MSAQDVRGPGAIALLCLRCLAVLAVANVTVGAAVAVVLQLVEDPSNLFGAGWGQGLYLLVVALAVAIVPIALVGFPAGVLTAHLLRGVSRESVHVAVFALVGAVLSVVLMAIFVHLDPIGLGGLVAAVEGAVGAGGARWWTGLAQARRRPVPSGPASDEQVQDALLDAPDVAAQPRTHAQG
jgi:hypothetical protein